MAEERRQAEARERALDAALQAELEAQRHAAETIPGQQTAAARAQIASKWVPAITSRVKQFWVRPSVSRADLQTTVNLRLQPGGAVVQGERAHH